MSKTEATDTSERGRIAARLEHEEADIRAIQERRQKMLWERGSRELRSRVALCYSFSPSPTL